MLSIAPSRIKRYSALARLLYKYGNRDLVSRAGLDSALDHASNSAPVESSQPPADKMPEALAADLERLGPAYIKLGQVLSTRADLLPPEYLHALSRLQDRVEPFPFADVEQIVQDELGVRLSKGFSSFNERPIAAASLGQVHRAKLRDGRDVAVKVQRPDAREQIAQDLQAFADIAAFLDSHTNAGRTASFVDVVEEFRKSTIEELDYRREAQNLVTLRANLAAFSSILVPVPIEGYCSGRVLTMTYVAGRKITDLNPVLRVDIDGSRLVEDLLHAYLHQVMVDGFFHADPHPGNVLLTDDGRLALVDVGMVSRLPVGYQEQLLKLILAIAEGRGDQAAEIAIRMGRKLDGFDDAIVTQQIGELVAKYQDASLDEMQAGVVMMEMSRIASEHHLRLPPELTLLGKTLLNLDEVGRRLAPRFDVRGAIRRHAAELMNERMRRSLTLAGSFSALLELKQFAEALPARLNRVFEAVSSNQFKIKMEVIDEGALIDGFQKVANRIALGLVLAALIVGAAMLMQIRTTATIFGYPALAMVLFLAAATGAVWLAISILTGDRRRPAVKK